MRVLMITGDKRLLEPGSEASKRLELQRSTVDVLEVVYWGRRSTRPQLPPGPFDIVTVQDPFWRGLFGLRVAKRLGAKLNVQLHTDLSRQGLLKKILAHFVLKRASSIRVVSQKLKDTLAARYPKTPMHVLPIFVDVEAVRVAGAVPLKQEYPQFGRYILVAARLEPEKDVAAAIQLMPEILKKVSSAGLFIAGEGSERENLEKLARNLGVEKKVVFLGYRSDIYSLYKSVDLLLQTSKFEGYGASVVEALAAGCPVVSLDVGIAREVGATVVSSSELAHAAIEALQSKARGALLLPVLSREAWVRAWQESLQ